MKYEIIEDERNPVERKIMIRVEPDSVQKVWKGEVARLAGETTLPGFRQGKAPHHLVERHVGRDVIWERVRDEAARLALGEILTDAEPAPLAPPKIKFDDKPDDEPKDEAGNEGSEEKTPAWEPGQPLEFTATYLLPPPTPEEIERDLMRGTGLEKPHADAPEPGIEAPKPPSTTPPDPRSEIPGSGFQHEAPGSSTDSSNRESTP